ncbi:hypothetical protein SD37_16860 [Amycolatopsis orientalis]|uniref:Tr-type G domain-containing protein n=1 Tax=Amycolatopsis orientalis TaxID=31958 RepID=A0A193BYA2_AMYOR|nr:GTP-binding protein [Amycolatopsis orientalis]ANN17148.1 hypothetical protein SD37_16860 [Amycolatopsis orientalis]
MTTLVEHAPTLRVAFVGEVDHGKSTLLGRLLYDTGAITPDRLGTSIGDGGLAFLLDGLVEEQADLFTLDTAQAVVETGGRRYVLIDVPGHLELLKNMVTGASHAEVGVVVVDCLERAAEQTARHLRVLAMMGVRACVATVTKMDLVGYDEKAFQAVAAEVVGLAEGCGIDLAAVVPVSAVGGLNVTGAVAPELSWYGGEPLLETLSKLEVRPAGEGPLRLQVQGLSAGRVLGRVLSGVAVPGQRLTDGRHRGTWVLGGIERFGEPPLERAVIGDCVGLLLDGEPPPSGALLTLEGEPASWGNRWTARVLCTAEAGFAAGDRCVVRHAGTSLDGTIAAIDRRWSSAGPETAGRGGEQVAFSETAALRLDLDRPAAADTVRDCPPLGRFMLCDADGHAVGLGVVDGISGEGGTR